MGEPIATASAIINLVEKFEDNATDFYQKLAQKYPTNKETFGAYAEESKKNKILVVRTYRETITDALEACFSFEGLNDDRRAQPEALAPEFGRFPWPRSAYAELAEGLVAQGAAAVVLDITFTEADVNNPDADAWFVVTFAHDPRLFLPMVRLDPAADGSAEALALDEHGAALGFARTAAAAPGARAALQLPFEQVAFAGRTGAINFLPDADGIGRRYHVDLAVHGWLIPSLPARVVRALGGATPAGGADVAHRQHGAEPRVESARAGGRYVPLVRAARHLVGTVRSGRWGLRRLPSQPISSAGDARARRRNPELHSSRVGG